MHRALRSVTHPDTGFMERVESGLQDYRQDAETWHAAMDLLSLGWRTFEAMMDENDG
jgi:hypothetical protein